MRGRGFPAVAGVAWALASGCSDIALETSPGGAVLAAYVLLAPAPNGTPRAQARVVVSSDATTCPELVEEDGRGHAMSFRENAHGFDVKVCEAVVPFDEPRRVSWNDQRLPVARLDPSRLVLFGDTGCKTKDCAPDALAKPFRDLSLDAAALVPAPDAILHVGDFNYRGTPGKVNDDPALVVYDAGDEVDSPDCRLNDPYVSQNAAYSEHPDAWDTWRVDFFEAAGELLATAPLVLTRGNHELCSRAGPGWFYFLDPSMPTDPGGQLSCPPQGGETPPTGDVLSHVVFLPPRILDLGTLRIAILDSANACDDFAPEETTAIYARQLRDVLAAVDDDTPTWILTHRPFLGVETLCADDAPGCEPGIINHTLEAALARALDGGSLPSSVRLFVSGHMHLFQSVTPAASAGRPPQLVVGDGGVETSSGPGDGPFEATVFDATTRGRTSSKHGFTHVETLSPDGSWQGVVVNPHEGETIAACGQPVRDGRLCRAAP